MASSPDNLLYNDDFEQVDPHQDESVTSTSLTGDMAEADRYNQGYEANDLLAEFGGSDEFRNAASSSSNEPLISFGSSHPDPIPEPIPEPVKEVDPVSTTDGCLFKNVDPRDDVMSYAATQSGSGDAYGEPSLPNIAESPGDCDTGHVFDGDKGTHVKEPRHRHRSDSSDENSDSDDESSSDETSSSESVDTDNAESSEDELNATVIEQKVTTVESDDGATENVVHTRASKREADVSDNHIYSESVVDTNLQRGSELECEGAIHQIDEGSDILDNMDSVTEGVQQPEYDNDKDFVQEKNLNEYDILDSTIDESNLEVGNIGAVASNPESQLPELIADRSDIAEKAEGNKGQLPILEGGGCPESISKTVAECKKLVPDEFESSKSSSTSSRESSPEHSNDSADYPSHEICIGEWNESPLLASEEMKFPDKHEVSTNNNNDIKGEIATEAMDITEPDSLEHLSKNVNVDLDESSTKPSSVPLIVSNDAVFESMIEATEQWANNNYVDDKETDVTELRQHVEGFMNEIDSLAEEADKPGDDVVEPVMKQNTQTTCLIEKINIGTEIKALSSRPREAEHKLDKLLHVTFQEPYSTIYYDPESPVVERDVIEIMEYDDEAKDIEGEKERIDDEDSFRNIDSDSDASDEESDSSGEFSYSPTVAESLYDMKSTTDSAGDRAGGEDALEMDNIVNKDNEIKLLNVSDAKDTVEILNIDADATEIEADSPAVESESSKSVFDIGIRTREDDVMPIEQLTESQSATGVINFNAGESIDTRDKTDVQQNEIVDSTLSDEESSITKRIKYSDSERDSVESMIIHEVEDLSEVIDKNTNIADFEIEDNNEEEETGRKEKIDEEDICDTMTDDNGAEVDIDQLKTDIHGLEKDIETVENNLPLDKETVLSIETTPTIEEDSEADVNQYTVLSAELDDNVIEYQEKAITEMVNESAVAERNSDINSIGNSNESNIVDSSFETEVSAQFDDNSEVESKAISEMAITENTEEAADDMIHTTAIDEEKETTARLNEQRRLEKRKRTSLILHQYTIKVLELVYWRDIKKTGVVFGSMMFMLISLACCSLMSVLAYLSLAVLTVTFSFRLYKNVMQAVQKTNDGHPFKKLMEMDIELKDEVIENAAENIAKHVNNCSRELRRLYLVGDYIDSIKFGMLLWLMTYFGSWFNGITLVIYAVVTIFTLPKVYETYKVQIDSNVNMVRAHLNNVMAQITAKIPFPKKKPKTQ